MAWLSAPWTALFYLVAAVCFIIALKGLSAPNTARRGNLIGAAGAVLAVLVTFFSFDLDHLGWIVGAIVVGSALGVPTARRVAMTQMPQLVALFNGVGGAAAALVAGLELTGTVPLLERGKVVGTIPKLAAHSGSGGWFAYGSVPHGIPATADTYIAAGAGAFTVLVGAISFSGSMVTFAKLQELMTTRPVTFPGGQYLFGGGLLAGVALGVAVVVDARDSIVSPWLLAALALVALVVGVLFVLPVGGADVPIVISLLNAFTGLTVAASGYVLDNTLLLVAGTLVGASGTILTRLMAAAMGRSLTSTLFGAFRQSSSAGAVGSGEDRPVRSGSAQDVAIMLGYARKVIIVPGYGLAVAQAQHTIRELAELLEARGIEVLYGIHPVAGRMPGHMNVLLAEANVPYEVLREMDQVNPEFASTDVALVVGANDVVNPAAKSTPGAPIYGMPILEVGDAQQVVFLKRSMRPGFAGIENELLYDPKTMLLFGDAKDSLTKVVAGIKAL
ncbi:NAD(P)(+) transhydrogenase (Re/Si-specific) subunit beta [Segeticoccus rhizosphaerae]|jgi:NAD(P) transhydrogenase subunit beta|uniref:NAD(P)(+) transhydrogenase (Re/Si-specific) subunit beta n=1 Tax=Segeticoccus rhizosphaerae TaxID=1104777 RepID=UPI0010BFC885|nr:MULTISPECIES: NAD(P)(+) transhydrogenase (Re/Si-specific) subunit beta [Intrasporangiaceae]